jgi:hypothetical protein
MNALAKLRAATYFRQAENLKNRYESALWLAMGTPMAFLEGQKAYAPEDSGDPPVTRPYYALYAGPVDATLDLNRLLATARRAPEMHFLLLGPVQLPARALEMLQAVENVHLLGALPEAELHKWLIQVDAGFLPVKPDADGYLQYPPGMELLLGTGKPLVISTPLDFPNLQKNQFVNRADDPASLAKLLRQEIAHDSHAKQVQRIRFARGRAWQRQARQLAKWIQQLDENGPIH